MLEQIEAKNTRLEADPARLRQIFWNLLSNAVKFTPEEGKICIRTADCEGWLRVEVNDTGAPMQLHKLSRIFDAFEQGTRNSPSGLGLGLAICKALVELHGRTIRSSQFRAGRRRFIHR